MAKLCPKGKAAAKRKFKVYPSAYANMYASAVCSGKVTPGGKKRKNYPKCVPIAKARAMSKGQRAGAVRRKQAKANTGPTPSRAATFAPKRKKAMGGGFMAKRQMMRTA